MSAGLTQKQIYSRIYSRLQNIRVRLEKAGVGTVYKRRQLTANQDINPNAEWNISYSVGNMSNGETVGLIRLTVLSPFQQTYSHSYFEDGLQRLIAEIGRKP